MTKQIKNNKPFKFRFFPQRFFLGEIFSEVINVTPEIAGHILQFCNVNNRTINQGNVAFIQRQMEEGTFNGLNGETLVVDNEGNLRDGQHRLCALRNSGKNIPMLFVFNTMPESILTIDTGKNRTLADVLSFVYPSKYIKQVASTSNFVMKFNKGSYSGKVRGKRRDKIDNTQGVKFIEDNPEFMPFIEEAMRLYANGDKLLTPTMFCGMYWTISERSNDRSKVDDFFYKFSTGMNLSGQDDPIYTLRKLFIEMSTNSKVWGRNLTKYQKVQAFIQMWNKYVKSEKITKIYLSKDFPEVLAA